MVTCGRLRGAGLAPLLMVLVAIAGSSACRGDDGGAEHVLRQAAHDDDIYYFHAVDGEVAVNGTEAGSFEPRGSSVPYGAGSYRFSSDAITLNFSLPEGALSASIGGVSEPGEFALQELSYSHYDDDAGVVYFCGVACDPCIVTVGEFSDDAITGEFSCMGLRSCDEVAPAQQQDVGDPDCGDRAASIIDLRVSFQLSQPTSGPLDY
jgi:hypothetical protein